MLENPCWASQGGCEGQGRTAMGQPLHPSFLLENLDLLLSLTGPAGQLLNLVFQTETEILSSSYMPGIKDFVVQ